jgi:membrane-bound acyltransferase YfiQ involved in biofilm formation
LEGGVFRRLHGSSRIGEIDALRGLAIIFVLVMHLYWLGQYFPITLFGVPIFVFVSGLALTYTYKNRLDLARYVKNRVLFVGLPYLFWSAMLMIAQNPNNSLNSPLLALETYLDYTFNGRWLTLWFVYMIFQFYIIFPFLLEFYKRLTGQLRNFLVLVTMCFSSIYFVVFERSYGVIVNLHLSTWIFYFVLGMAIGYNWEKVFGTLSLKKNFTLLATVLYGIFVYSIPILTELPFILPSFSYATLFVLWGSTITIIVFLVIFSNWKRTPIRILGTFSFGIFLTHRILMTVFVGLPCQILVIPIISIGLVWLIWKIPHSEYIIGKKTS